MHVFPDFNPSCCQNSHHKKKCKAKKLLFYIAVPPSIRPDPPDGNYVVKKGRKVELKCIASGNPDPTITWTRQVKSFVFFFAKKNWAELIRVWEHLGAKLSRKKGADCTHLLPFMRKEIFPIYNK